MRVADYIGQNIVEQNVTNVFGMSGANIEELYQAIFNHDQVSIVLAKNEYNAATMAIGSYYATKNPAVVLTTSGPGILNTVPVLAEAYTSKIPLVLISGLVPGHLEGIGAFQDTSGLGGSLDISEMLKQCSCYQIKIKHPNDIPEAMNLAFESARIYKRPAIVLIPKEIFSSEITNFNVQIKSPISLESNANELKNAALYFQKIEKENRTPPLIILGEELIHQKNLKPILDFIEKSSAAVALTANSKGLFDHHHPQFLGLIGIMGHIEVDDFLSKTDNVIIVDSDLCMLDRFGMESLLAKKDVMIIRENKSLSEFSPVCSGLTYLHGNIEKNFTILNEFISSQKTILLEKVVKEETDKKSYNQKNIIQCIQNSMEVDANVFIDAGNTGAFVVHNLQTQGKGICYISLGMGGMGNSIGASIGAAAASKKRSFAFLGDGSFLMYGLEIHTALQYNLPVIFFIFNNNSHGMCSTREHVFLGGETGLNNFKPSYFAHGLGTMFPGINAFEVNNLSELEQKLELGISSHAPCIISINIPNTESPPFKSFKKITEV